jgi:hypothetical protein
MRLSAVGRMERIAIRDRDTDEMVPDFAHLCASAIALVGGGALRRPVGSIRAAFADSSAPPARDA